MYKKITNKIVLASISLIWCGCATKVYAPYTDLEISTISAFPAASKDTLFEASKMWIAQEFKSAKSVIEYESKTEGVVIGNGIIKYPCIQNTMWCDFRRTDDIKFVMKIEVKNEKAKFTFSNIRHILYADKGVQYENNRINTEDTALINSTLLGLSSRLQKTVNSRSTNSNW